MAISGEYKSIKIPSWFPWVVSAAVAIFSAGWAAATNTHTNANDLAGIQLAMNLQYEAISTRLCRLERAAKIEPWESCK